MLNRAKDRYQSMSGLESRYMNGLRLGERSLAGERIEPLEMNSKVERLLSLGNRDIMHRCALTVEKSVSVERTTASENNSVGSFYEVHPKSCC